MSRMTEGSITLGHGGGGKLSRDLVQDLILPRFGDGPLAGLPDAATLPAMAGPLVMTTDSFVVSPLVFPGGDIGHLAVHGTVNDIAVAGGRPRWISLAMILEEGLPVATLERVLDSVAAAAREAGVRVVTGDTKVVNRGTCDGMYITTAGVGEALPWLTLAPARVADGDAVIVSGTLGDHGMAIMAARNGMAADEGPRSDTASVFPLVAALEPFGEAVRFMRDPTRGGAAAVLNELVDGRTDIGILLDEPAVPLHPAARAVADLLGLDPLHAASEGRVIAVADGHAADAIVEAWRALPAGADACRAGAVVADRELAGCVAARTLVGGRRMVDVPRGELLPRIC